MATAMTLSFAPDMLDPRDSELHALPDCHKWSTTFPSSVPPGVMAFLTHDRHQSPRFVS